ncbi:MAG: ferritin-like domain-containing protein [Pyrinomonadaceae bacterium]|nr:ferritin-like domain-containing protein [Pyrinomonadaceae bacterium]
MVFETNRDVLEWYERQPRALTPAFISSIPWQKVNDHPFDERLIPILFYMRDVETLTDMYHRELLRTPTGKDPHISKFMERWGVEEVTHGEVLNRFLNELGVETGDNWQDEIRRNVTMAYNANSYLLTTLTNLVGKKFTATHMTFGAIHEMEAAQGYRRLVALADHPVLTQILNGIIREESAHCQFYWSVARLELNGNELARRIARFITEHFWAPVGQGALSKKRTAYMIATLFSDDQAMSNLDKTVTQRVRQLPGFADITKMTETIGGIAKNSTFRLETA